MLGTEPGIDGEQLTEAGKEQPGPDEEHERQRDLEGDQRAPHEARVAAGRAGAPVLAQDQVQVEPRELRERDGADDEALHQRDPDREGDDDPVHPDLVTARQLRQAERREPLEPGRAERQPEEPAGQRQQQRLGEQLPRDPRVSGAERMARGELLHSSAGAHEDEIGDVGGGDEQHEQHAAPEQVQRPAHVADDIGFERHDARAVTGVDDEVPDRARALDVPPRERIDLLLCLGDGGAGREPRDLLVVLAPARVLRSLLVGEHHRGPERDVGIGERESLRHHADNGVVLAIQADVTPDRRVAARMGALPVGEAEDRDTRAAGDGFLGRERAAAVGGRLEHVEERRRDVQCGDALRRLALADRVAGPLVERLGLEGADRASRRSR